MARSPPTRNRGQQTDRLTADRGAGGEGQARNPIRCRTSSRRWPGLSSWRPSPCRGLTSAGMVTRAPRRLTHWRRDDRRRLPHRLPHLPREYLHRRHNLGRRGPTRHRQRPLRRRAPPHVRRRARHDRRHPPGDWLMVGPDRGRRAGPDPRVATAARGETFLAANLAGYDAYRGRVRYRLAPIFW